MKKSLTLALVLAAMAVFAGLGVAQQTVTPKTQPTSNETKPAPTPPVPLGTTTINTTKSNTFRVAPKVMTGKVTQVNTKDKTFAVAVTFSTKTMKGDFSRDTFKVGETIDITYTQTPGGGAMEATTIKGSKSNGSYRVATSPNVITGKLTSVNAKDKTFAVEVKFSAAKLSKFPTVGVMFDITYTDTPVGQPLEASNLNLSKSNINYDSL
jgi:hypothetical protein